MGRPRSWTDDQLREAEAVSGTFKEVHEGLGQKHGGGSHSAVRLRIAELGLDTSHFEPRRRTATPRRPPRSRGESTPGALQPTGSRLERIDSEERRAAVQASVSIRETLTRLDLAENGSTYAGVSRTCGCSARTVTPRPLPGVGATSGVTASIACAPR